MTVRVAFERFVASASAPVADRGVGLRSERRELNDKIAGVGRSFPVPAQLPFLCECGRPGCAERVSLRTREYDSIRSRGGAVTVAH